MEWDQHAATWDDDRTVRAYAGAAFDTVMTQLAARQLPLADMRALDFGCGTGLLTAALADTCRAVVGLDPSTKMIEVLRTKIDANGWTHVHAIASTLEDALQAAHLQPPFDLITCSSVCAFLPDYPATAARLVSLLRPHGVFMQFDWERDDTADEPFGLARSQIETTLRAAGLDAVAVDTAFNVDVEGQTMSPLLGIGQRSDG